MLWREFLILALFGVAQGANYICPLGWTKIKNKCIIVKSEQMSWKQASEYCKAQRGNSSLVEIFDAETNTAVTGLLKNTNMEYWINAVGLYDRRRYSYMISWKASLNYVTRDTYNNFEKFPNHINGEQCGFMDDNGYWFLTERCSSNKRFICSKEMVCEKGYYGNTCGLKCHCYKTGCDRGTGVCPYGCEQNWMGLACNKVKEPAKVAIYCFKPPSQEQYALIRVDPVGVKYDQIDTFGDGRDNPDACNKTMLHQEINGVFSLKITFHDDGTVTPDCSPTKISQDVYQWKLRTEETEGFHSYYDRTYQLKCDFSRAETLNRKTASDIKRISVSKKIKVLQTTEDVKLVIQDPVTSEKVSQAAVGSRIQFAMILDKHSDGDVSANSISPYNCKCSTLDGKITRYLTDADGCPVKNSPVFSLTGSDSTVVSNVFDVFTINDNTNIVFSCKFEFCFQANMTKCADRCSFSLTRRLLSKRSVTSQPRVGSVSATLHLINHHPAGKDDKKVFTNNKLNYAKYFVGFLGTIVSIGFLLIFIRHKNRQKENRLQTNNI